MEQNYIVALYAPLYAQTMRIRISCIIHEKWQHLYYRDVNHSQACAHGISSLVRLVVKLVMIASFSVIQVNSGNIGMKYLEQHSCLLIPISKKLGGTDSPLMPLQKMWHFQIMTQTIILYIGCMITEISLQKDLGFFPSQEEKST